MIENNRFLLRKPIILDIPDLLLIKNNKNTSKLLGGNTPNYSKTDINNWINYHNNCVDEELFVIYDKIEKIVIGHVGLYKIDKISKTAEFGILIGNDDYIGRGVGQSITLLILDYGFNKIFLDRISLSLLDANIPALNLYKKLGFREEGRQLTSVFKNNRYYNIIFMAISKKEYENK